jgi:methylmalonyl-CoA/ethylmalonyl-CoA epimerase
MVIDHIGIVVKSIELGAETWVQLFGYEQATQVVTNTRQKVNVVFMEKPGSLTVKLLEPTDPSSPVYSFSRKGGGIHHICFRGESLTEDLKSLVEKGARVLVQPEAGEAFENESIAFVYANHGLNIEVIDTKKRAGRIRKADL